jgi:hypothetical protein
MKKLFFITAFTLFSSLGFSQEIGVRFGDVLDNNVALDGIIRIGEFNRVHADISFGSGVGIEALWDFLYRPLGGEAFNWYLGAGPSMLIDDDLFLFGFSGEIGLEYRFNTVPIAVGLDWRPTLFIVEETEFDAGGFGLNVRFVIGGNK